MLNKILFFALCVILSDVTTQTIDNLTSSPAPVIIQNLKSSSPCSDSKWEEILPALQTIKSTSKLKKERLSNVVRIIKYLLSDESENNKESKMLEQLKEQSKYCEDMFPNPTMPDFDSIVEERLKAITEIINDRNYMMEGPEEAKSKSVKEETAVPKNKTADFSRILTKIASALAKLKENQSTDTQKPNMVPIFRSKNGCKNEFSTQMFENPKQTGMNPMSSLSMFNIPCQRASDILEETANFPLPKEIFCDNPSVNLNALAKNTKLNLENLPFKNVVPNSISCVDSDDTIAILFKPKTISLMQVYGNLLKKITITVLVPYYVSKLAL